MAAVVRPCVQLLVITCLSLHYVSGSKISLTTSTPFIKPLLTSSINLRCALEDNASSGTVIGRSVSSNSINAKYVTSIFVYLNGNDIATISEHEPAKAISPNSTLLVSGAISGSYGYIVLHWKFPDASHGGNYTCEVGAIDDIGHQIKYSSYVNIDVVTPTIDDLVHHIILEDRINKVEIAMDKAQIANNTAQIAMDKAQIATNTAQIAMDTAQITKNTAQIAIDNMEIKTLKIEINQLKTNTQNMQSEINQLKTKTQNMQSEKTEANHFENGVVICGPLGTDRTGSHYPKSVSKSVTFKTSYKSAPTVYIALKEADVDRTLDAWYNVNVVKTDAHGFTVSCELERNCSPCHVGELELSWLSLP